MIGTILYVGAIIVFVAFCAYWYIPKIIANPQNGDIVITAIWWGLCCLVVGVIGVLLAKSEE